MRWICQRLCEYTWINHMQKIISGSENAGKFYLLPQDNASRAQVATILMQYCAL